MPSRPSMMSHGSTLGYMPISQPISGRGNKWIVMIDFGCAESCGRWLETGKKVIDIKNGLGVLMKSYNC